MMWLTLAAARAQRSEIESLRQSQNRNDPLRSKAAAERDAELDQTLRELADELLTEEIPERLLRVIRSAAQTEHEAQQENATERGRYPPQKKAGQTTG